MSKDEISVPRELLERATKDYTGRPMWDALENDRLASVEELRALLARPNTCTKDGGQCGLGGYCEPCRNVESAADHHWNCPNCPPPGATHTISGQFYRKADGSWLVFGHKRDWVPSDAPAGWNDTNLVPLLPEPALARCTCPSGDGSLRWPCPVHQAEAAAASFADGIEAAAKLIERRMDEYVNEHGIYDHDTGYTEFPGNGEETVEEWLNLAEGIRAIKPDAKEPVCQPEPVGWQFLQDGKWWNGDDRIKDHRLNTEAAGYPTRNVFASHPAAQAPVVLPERKTYTADGLYCKYTNGWNACLDEFKRLNPGITEAAPLRKS